MQSGKARRRPRCSSIEFVTSIYFTIKRFAINSLTGLLDSRRPILACYLSLGDPGIACNQPAIYVECGVDIFEVGVPCEDPYMDGPIISRSMQRTLRSGVRQCDIAQKMSELRDLYSDAGIVVMGYDNMRLAELVLNGRASFDAVLRIGPASTPDKTTCPELSNTDDIDCITFIPYQMSAADIAAAGDAQGYIMLQAAAGKTGLRNELDESNAGKIRALKEAGVTIPILLGFGISTAAQAAAAIELGADGVIIGSACVLNAEKGEQHLRHFLTSVREAMDAAGE